MFRKNFVDDKFTQFWSTQHLSYLTTFDAKMRVADVLVFVRKLLKCSQAWSYPGSQADGRAASQCLEGEVW